MNNAHHRNALIALFVLILAMLVPSCSSPATPTPPPPPLPDTPAGVPTVVETSVPSEQPTVTEENPTATLEAHAPTAQISTPTLAVAAAALVNGQPIVLEEYEAQVALAMDALSQQQTSDPNTEEDRATLLQLLRRQILDSMIDQALIEQTAARNGISISEEHVEAEMTRLIGEDVARFEEWLTANGLTRDSFKAQLQQQLLGAAFQEYMVGSAPPEVEQVHARHILVMSEAEAIDILVKLRSGQSFATLAKQYSQDNGSSDIGGDLGFFPRSVMPTEIEAVAFALSPGQTSGTVKTDFGYHIIEVVEKDPARKVPDEMLPTWRQNTFLRWLEAERLGAQIEYLIPME
jgi:foldase protein PrsA